MSYVLNKLREDPETWKIAIKRLQWKAAISEIKKKNWSELDIIKKIVTEKA